MQELTEQEHNELMECEFVVKGICNEGPYITPGKLVEIEYDIGITIIDKEDHTNYLYCLLGPTVCKNDGINTPDGLYDTLFQGVIQDIKNGVIDLTSKESGNDSTAFTDFCAFNR